MEIKELKIKLQLEKLAETFEIPEFQRKLYSAHVKILYKNIKEHGLLNNIFYVSPAKYKGRWLLVDGQQRLAALGMLYEEGILEETDAVLRILPEKGGIALDEAYRTLNITKSISMSDLTKALTGKYPLFFDMLDQYCSHYKSISKIPFFYIISAYNYSLGGPFKTDKDFIEPTLVKISRSDIEKIKNILINFQVGFGLDSNRYIYSPVLFKNIFKWGWNNGGKLSNHCIQTIKRDKFLEQNAKIYNAEAAKTIYDYIHNKLSKV